MSPIRSLVAVLCGACLSAAEFVVAPQGDDRGPGTAAQPLATIAVAQQRARQAILAGERRIQVRLRAGTWILSEPLVLTAADVPAGGEASWEGESGTVLSGGEPIATWTSAGPGRWRAKLATPASVTSLWAGLVPLPLTRWPATGWARLSAVGTRWGITPKPPRGSGIATVLHAWGAGRCPVQVAEGSAEPAASLAWPPVPELAPVVGRPLLIEGLIEPGETPGWRQDTAGSLVLAAADAPVAGAIVYPRLPTVVRIAGTADAPVRRLNLSNFTIAHAAWPLSATGVIGVQAGHVREDDILLAAPAALQVTSAEQVTLSGVRIAACAGGGIAIGARCAAVRLSRCVVEEVGATGIMIGWRGRDLSSLGADWATPGEVPRGIIVERCRVSRAARRDPGSVGIAALFTRDVRIRSNLVEDLPYSGISLGFRWDTSPTSQRGAVVEHNHIRRVMGLLTDGGGIYTLGWQPGAQLTGNLIEDVGSASPVEGAPSGGLFFDNGSKGIAVEGNLLARITGEPLRFNGCAPSWLLLGDNQVLADAERRVPSGMAEGVGP